MNLKSRSKIPLYEQIYGYIKTDIQQGRFAFGEKLPSTRALSKHLEVSRSTVELAYEQLLSEGYIESKPYKGFFVAQTEELYHLERENKQIPAVRKEEKKYRYDFSPNGVDLRSFPYNAWRKLSKDILIDDRIELFRSGDSKGEYGFRSAICSYLHQARGVNCTPEQIIVGAGSDYILIHDGARPCVTKKMIQAAIEEARISGACVIGMPVKDTIKISDAGGFVEATPDRSKLWQIQTPQAFSYSWIRQAYDKLFSSEEYQRGVTDDAMVLEAMSCHRVRLIEGSYSNMKVTTPEDMAVAEALMNFSGNFRPGKE